MKNKITTRHKGRSPLTLRERSIIEVRWCQDGKTITEIADALGRNKSSISREIAGRPRRGQGRYDAERAHERACERIKARGNTPKMVREGALCVYVEKKLRIGWSPEQIAIRLPMDYPDESRMRVSYEAIYQHVYRQIHRSGNGIVKSGCEDLRPYLARRHTRRTKKGFRRARRAQRDASLPSIDARPAVVEDRSRIGDWEDDTLVSRKTAARIKSANERKSGVVFFGKTKDGTARACDRVLIERLSALPPKVRRTLTRDRGSENLRFTEVSEALSIRVFFAHAYCSYERGSNENANGLFRRYFPKGTNWNEVSDEDIARVERLINERPRKRHGGYTPVEVFLRETGVALYP